MAVTISATAMVRVPLEVGHGLSVLPDARLHLSARATVRTI
jgi:hypothetical protein